MKLAKEGLQALVGSAARLAECRDRRAAWVRETAAAMRAAQQAMDRRCEEALDQLTEAAFERMCGEEEAKVDAFRKPLMDAAKRDRWPRFLHEGGL